MGHVRSAMVFLSLVLAGCGSDDAAPDPSGPPIRKVDRSRLTDLGTAPLDYADPNFWACLPGNDPNECHADLDATLFAADGTSRVVEHVPAANPAFDCFYV